MRRPNGPALRTPPVQTPERPRPEDRRSRPAAESAEAPEPKEPKAPAARASEPLDLTARLERPAPATRPSPGLAASFASWRELRRAVNARRRIEREEARRFTARTRRRRQFRLAVAAFVVVVLGGAVVTAYSPVMALRHIDVVGARSVNAAEVQKALAGELGKPLPLVTSADVRRALDDFRLIESYSTQLEPPSTLVVRITERTPLAVVKHGASYEVVDEAGVVLSAGATPQAGLPVVTVPSGQQPQDSAAFRATAAVIAALPAAIRGAVTAASASSANNVTLTLSGGKKVVWGDTEQMRLKTADLEALLKGAAGASVYDVSSPRAPITR